MHKAFFMIKNESLSKSIVVTVRLVMGALWLAYPLAGQDLASEIEHIATKNDMMGGAVVVFCETGIVESHYFGKADNSRNFPVDHNTQFRIASISKTITAIAIMQLVEQSLLHLDSDIGPVLGYKVENPHFPDVPVTPRMLLSHTSSLTDGPTYDAFLGASVQGSPIPNLSEILTPTGRYYSADQFSNTIPGSFFSYSNINYVILGTLIEKVTGKRFDGYCQENIFRPLNIDASFNVNDLQDINQLAVIYRKPNGIWTPQTDNYQGVQPVFTNLAGYIPGTNGARFGPQGGLRISASDLARIFISLNHTITGASAILSQSGMIEMIADQWTYNGTNGDPYHGLFLSWGLGIHRITSTAGKDVVLPESKSMYGHAGEAYGLVSGAYFDNTRKAGLVFMTNGVGIGYHSDDTAAFYTVEQEIFRAVEKYGQLQRCQDWAANDHTRKTNRFTLIPDSQNNSIQLKADFFQGAAELLQVRQIDGKVILEKQINSDNSTIDISGLGKGAYLFCIGDTIIRFVKH